MVTFTAIAESVQLEQHDRFNEEEMQHTLLVVQSDLIDISARGRPQAHSQVFNAACTLKSWNGPGNGAN